MLRKYVLEASLLKVLRAAVPIVTDAEMTAGGLHRFHAVLQVKRTSPAHDGLQRNAILAAFGALKDLDMVIVVDHDIDIRDPLDVEYALATRMEASRDLIVIPEARGHEYVRSGNQRHHRQARHRRDGAVRRAGALLALRLRADGRDCGEFFARCGADFRSARSMTCDFPPSCVVPSCVVARLDRATQ